MSSCTVKLHTFSSRQSCRFFVILLAFVRSRHHSTSLGRRSPSPASQRATAILEEPSDSHLIYKPSFSGPVCAASMDFRSLSKVGVLARVAREEDKGPEGGVSH